MDKLARYRSQDKVFGVNKYLPILLTTRCPQYTKVTLVRHMSIMETIETDAHLLEMIECGVEEDDIPLTQLQGS